MSYDETNLISILPHDFLPWMKSHVLNRINWATRHVRTISTQSCSPPCALCILDGFSIETFKMEQFQRFSHVWAPLSTSILLRNTFENFKLSSSINKSMKYVYLETFLWFFDFWFVLCTVHTAIKFNFNWRLFPHHILSSPSSKMAL